MSDSLPSEPATAEHRHVTRSIHAPLLEQSIPDWLTQASAQHHAALKNTAAPLPRWYRQATKRQRKAFDDSLAASFTAECRHSQTMAGFQDIHAFAEPLLVRKLKQQFGVEADLNHIYLHLFKAVTVSILEVQVGSFELSRMSLLQAALHNFEEAESKGTAFHHRSGFYARKSAADAPEAVALAMTVPSFIQACRALDIGGEYQRYLKRFFYSQPPTVLHSLRESFIAMQKTALRAAAERALLQGDIEPADHASILEIIDGRLQPRQGNGRIWFCELSLMRRRLNGCLCFAICERHENPTDLLLYIPDDPHHPLKRYKAEEFESAVMQRFTAREGLSANDPSPTPYQRFFSRFVPYADRPYYFSQFTRDAPDATFTSKYWRYIVLVNKFVEGINPLLGVTSIDLPAPVVLQEPEPDPFLNPTCMPFKGLLFWDDNIDPWDYLFERHRDQLIEDARGYAMPTEAVDAEARKALFARLLDIGMLALNVVSLFVPVLGEVMMAVMACQLLEETIEGVAQWSEGDRKAATAHFIGIGENLLLLGVMAGVGKGIARITAVEATPVIEDLHSVTLPDGNTRLCRAELTGYELPGEFQPDSGPDTLGQFHRDGKSYIRIEGNFYEQLYDPAQKCWRIRHPVDLQAYQPVLTHNQAGAWRHNLESPSRWTRLQLLRRMGHSSEPYSDEQLLQLADISGVSDNTLRKMHLDNRLPPPELIDAFRLFEADRNVTQMIEQVVSGHAIDERYLFALPLVTELPNWPAGRTLQIYDNPRLVGSNIEYGLEHLFVPGPAKPPIRMTRSDVMNGEMPMRILAALDEAEISTLLGAELAQNRGWRPQALRDRIADYARSRRPALFDSVYQGSATTDPLVDKLQRVHPGLSEAAAQEILGHADAEAMATLQSGAKVPRTMIQEARWYARRGRVIRALAGLHMDNMLTADTRRLTLHTLSKLPGWSNDLRLEVREGAVGGRLIDGIGSDAAGVRRYLVRKGPRYQVFSEQGEILYRPARGADCFYTALLHALPSETRQALGVPHVTQGAKLQRTISGYAKEHVDTTAAILAPQVTGKRAFKPPQRIREHLLGYLASGEGAIGTSTINPVLIARVWQLYPRLTPPRINTFLLKLMRAGRRDAQILLMIETLHRQWYGLEQILDHWVASSGGLAQNKRVARSLKKCWRDRPFAAEEPDLAQLQLICHQPLPALHADFSHVTALRLEIPTMGDPQMRSLLRNFPDLEYLDLRGSRLVVNPISPGYANRLLELDFSGNPLLKLDVRQMWRLRKLFLQGTRLQEWPRGAEDLHDLSWLDLRNTLIRELPPAVLERDSLLLDTNLTGCPLSEQTQVSLRQAQRRLEQLKGLPEGALARFALEEVPPADTGVFETGSLLASRLLPYPPEVPDVANVPSFVQRLRRIDPSMADEDAISVIENLRQGASDAQINQRISEWGRKFATITRHLNGWIFIRRTGNSLFGGRWTASEGRREAAWKIIECWKKGLMGRSRSDDLVLDLAGIRGLGALPRLPPEFLHVEALNLRGLGANENDLQGFLPVFSRLRRLDLSLNELHSVPEAIAGMEWLEELALSSNRFNDFPALVQRLSHLQLLSRLRLNYNRLTQFDGVPLLGMPRLQQLELKYNQINRFEGPVSNTLQGLLLDGNELHRWPSGVLQARGLEVLSLIGNPIGEIPVEAFDGSHDRLMAGTRLSSMQRFLSVESVLRVRDYLDRQGGTHALGISRERLERWIEDDARGPASDSELDTSADDDPDK